MGPNPLDTLLEQLSCGDEQAAGALLKAYEPSLRLVIRRMLPARLRSKFDSADVVQGVWAEVVEGFRGSGWRFANAEQLRAFLVRLARNRFIDQLRRERVALEHQRRLDTDRPGKELMALEAEPEARAQADELWQRMLVLCPPAHRDMLRLKRAGYSLGEIAAQTGLHEGSVRRILYDLARRMATSQH